MWLCSVLPVVAADPPIDGPPVWERKLDPRVSKFFATKEAHARALTKQLHLNVSPDIWAYFEAGKRGEWSGVKRLWRDLAQRSGQYSGGHMDETVQTVAWQPVLEAELAYEQFSDVDVKFIDAFAGEVIDSIPPGSIYFGGTDYGRGLITALCRDHAKAKPFYTLSQNPLASGPYLAYLRAIYGRKLKLPTDEDSKRAFDEYSAAVRIRLKKGELKPGEKVTEDDNGKLSVSGTHAVMSINALIAKQIFDTNPAHEFFMEESFPFDWMYPHLTPHGLILKVNRERPGEISEALVKKDTEFWARETRRWIGGWLKRETSLKEIVEFTDRVFVEVNLDGFTGDPDFVVSGKRVGAHSMFSRLRTAQASVYAWHAVQPSSPEVQERAAKAADFAFRQAFALCPWAHEVVFRYREFLGRQGRKEDAVELLKAASRANPGDKTLWQRVRELTEEK